jgi:HEAT repeat protein
LKDKDTDTQLALVVAAVPQLINNLGDRDLDVRMAVAESLGQIGPPARAAVPALTLAVNQGDAEMREKAILALQGIGQASVTAIPALIDVMGQEGYFQLGGGRGTGTKVRRAAAELLGQFGKDASAAVPALRKALQDPDAETREAAAGALLRITNP